MKLLDVITPPEVLNRLGLIYAAYRIFLSFFLVILFVLTSESPIVGRSAPFVFVIAITLYCFASLIEYLTLRTWLRWQQLQVLVMLVIDVVVLSILLYSNGGPSLQMSMLYLVVVMAASILLPQTRALFIALLAVITVVYQQFYFAISNQASIGNVSGALLLSLSFVGIYSLGQLATRRLQQVESIASSRYRQIEQLQSMNQSIIEEMQNGILVVNQSGVIVLVNNAAKALLKSYYARAGQPLNKISESLARHIQASINNGQTESFFLPNIDPRLTEGLKLSCILLHPTNSVPSTLVIMDNLSKTNQEAQQLKLASLGRLTAGIAHEIRNPLAAISQASELLIENKPSADDHVLLGMIQKQSLRINRIIEDILQLSRDAKSEPILIPLQDWIEPVLAEALPNAAGVINYNYQSAVTVRFDASQLQQVLINLVGNALHHAQKAVDPPRIDINIGLLHGSLMYLDVVDSGAGIPRHAQTNLFEPFFTTESNGTGLGLYLSRAYCEANGASLSNIPTPKGACFRIVFSRMVA